MGSQRARWGSALGSYDPLGEWSSLPVSSSVGSSRGRKQAENVHGPVTHLNKAPLWGEKAARGWSPHRAETAKQGVAQSSHVIPALPPHRPLLESPANPTESF